MTARRPFPGDELFLNKKGSGYRCPFYLGARQSLISRLTSADPKKATMGNSDFRHEA
jgi:hypothetical protein